MQMPVDKSGDWSSPRTTNTPPLGKVIGDTGGGSGSGGDGGLRGGGSGGCVGGYGGGSDGGGGDGAATTMRWVRNEWFPTSGEPPSAGGAHCSMNCRVLEASLVAGTCALSASTAAIDWTKKRTKTVRWPTGGLPPARLAMRRPPDWS